MTFLLPSLTSSGLNISAILNNPMRLNQAIAKKTEEQLLLTSFFSPAGGRVQGGGILYSVMTGATQYSSRDAEQRAPGAEYPILTGDELRRLAQVEDWGGKVYILDEETARNDEIAMANRITQLANTVARQLDRCALAAIDQALTGLGSQTVVTGNSWSNLVTIGDPVTLTQSSKLPTADFANAQLLADVEDLGIVYDTLVVAPQEAMRLRAAYADRLATVLDSAGLTMRVSNLVAAGTAYMVAAKQAGRVGFEEPIKTETWREEATRKTWVQTYVVPAFAVNNPHAVRKITGLAG